MFEARDDPVTDDRCIRVRNPWGEWTRREQDELLSELGVPIIPGEGSFWMSYSDFIRGFACADLCHTRPGWNGRSFDMEFDGMNSAASTGVRSGLKVRSAQVLNVG